MATSLFITKTPIIDSNEHINAFILNCTPLGSDSNVFKIETLIDTLQDYGFKEISDSRNTFIPITFDANESEAIHSLPIENMTLLLSNATLYSSREIEKIKELTKLGYNFALILEKTTSDLLSTHKEILELVTYLLVNTTKITLGVFKEAVNSLKNYEISYIATHIENEKVHAEFASLSDFFSGDYYTKELEVSKNTEIDETYKNTLDLLNTLETQESIDDIALSFTSYPEITLKLLQHLNSPSFNLQKAIKSIRHALLLIGRKSLKKWLLLIAFSSSDSQGSSTNPLMYTVETRITLMTHLANILQTNEGSLQEEAPFVAVLSLLDRLIETTKSDMFNLINVDEKVKVAVLEHENTLGKLLSLTIAIENFDTNKVDFLLNDLGIDKKEFEQSLVESYFTPKEG